MRGTGMLRMLPFLTGLGAALATKARTPIMDVKMMMMSMPTAMHYNIPPAARLGCSGVPRARRAKQKRLNRIKGGRR